MQVNKHEGVHIGLPFRTNERFSKVVSLEASVGYGIRDRSAKGMGRVSVNLPTPRKNTLQLEYNDHYTWSEVDDFDRLLRENSMGWGNFDFTAYAFEALHRDSLCVNTALRQRQLQLHWFADWTPHLETHAYVRAGWQDGYAYQSFSGIARLSWGERKYDGFFLRRYAYSSKYPVLYLGTEFGHWANNQGQSSSRLYAHLRVMLRQQAQLGMGGQLTYALQAGALFGHVPTTLLWQADMPTTRIALPSSTADNCWQINMSRSKQNGMVWVFYSTSSRASDGCICANWWKPKWHMAIYRTSQAE